MAALDIAHRAPKGLAAARQAQLVQDAAQLEARFGQGSPEAVIEAAVKRFGDKLALVSSFGADSAVLLHLASRVDPGIDVVFLETGRHFGETLDYVETLKQTFGLTRLRFERPNAAQLAAEDEGEDLYTRDADRCCEIRKVMPLDKALARYDAWFTGRRRDQTSFRAAMPVFEADGARIKINPLARWTKDDMIAHTARHDLPAHSLVAQNYPSIGCLPCTQPVAPGADPRSGRWRGLTKTECGIHLRPASSPKA